jgi:RNA polymerase subunit RPABC4/transcription elongation factor Spt4
MDLESILNTIQPFIVMFAALLAAFLTATWIGAVIWAFRDIRSRSRDIFAQVLATLMVLVFFPLFPVPGLLLYLILRPRETLSEVYERSLEEEVLLQGIEERLACPGCNRRIEDAFMICPTCHTRLKKACPSCGRLLHLRWNICPYCGAVQTAAKVSAPSPRTEAPAEAFILHPRPEVAAEPYASPLEPEAEVEPSSLTLKAEMPAEANTEEETIPPDWIDSSNS